MVNVLYTVPYTSAKWALRYETMQGEMAWIVGAVAEMQVL